MENLRKKKLFLFDIDGTLAIGDTLFDGSRKLLSHIEKIGGRAYYITNNSTKSRADYVKKFREVFQLECTEEQFITSGYMTLLFLKKNFPREKIFVLGTASFIAELRKNSLHITENPKADIACVVAAYDSELTYDKLTAICQVLFTTDAPFFATNPDLRCPIGFGFIPDCGAVCDMITKTTGKTPTYLGKPNPNVVRLCLSLSGFTGKEALVVGDRLYTDIACGINAQTDTCVVFTGETCAEDIKKTPYRPTYAFQTIRDLYHALQ